MSTRHELPLTSLGLFFIARPLFQAPFAKLPCQSSNKSFWNFKFSARFVYSLPALRNCSIEKPESQLMHKNYKSKDPQDVRGFKRKLSTDPGAASARRSHAKAHQVRNVKFEFIQALLQWTSGHLGWNSFMAVFEATVSWKSSCGAILG